jgi:hypothetical protein
MLHKTRQEAKAFTKHTAFKPVSILTSTSSFIVLRVVCRQTTADSQLLPVNQMKGEPITATF